MHALLLLLALAADPAPEPAVAAPTEPRAEITGDKTIVVGKMARLSAAASRNVVSYRWLVDPEPDDMEVIDGVGPNGQPLKGSELRITHDAGEDTELRVQLIVGSAGGATDVAFASLVVRPALSTHAAAQAAPANPAAAELAGIDSALGALAKLHEFTKTLAPQPAAAAPPGQQLIYPPTTAGMAGFPPSRPENAVSLPELVQLLARKVRTNNRSAEAKQVAGCFRSVADRIKIGTFADGDPWEAVSVQAREALGSAYPLWRQAFFVELLKFIDQAKAHGAITDPASSVQHLEDAARALGSL